MFIGDGAKMVRDAFELAKEKSPAKQFDFGAVHKYSVCKLLSLVNEAPKIGPCHTVIIIDTAKS